MYLSCHAIVTDCNVVEVCEPCCQIVTAYSPARALCCQCPSVVAQESSLPGLFDSVVEPARRLPVCCLFVSRVRLMRILILAIILTAAINPILFSKRSQGLEPTELGFGHRKEIEIEIKIGCACSPALNCALCTSLW